MKSSSLLEYCFHQGTFDIQGCYLHKMHKKTPKTLIEKHFAVFVKESQKSHHNGELCL